MHYYIFEVSFPSETVVEQGSVMIVARGIFKTELFWRYAGGEDARKVSEAFMKAANTKEGDTIKFIGEIEDDKLTDTLDLWMKNRTVLDPVGLLSDD